MTEKIIQNVIWIDPNVDNNENKDYQKDIQKMKCKLKCFKKVEEAIIYLKTIKFEEVKIIISGKSYIKFIQSILQNILVMYIVPKIIIFTSDKEKFIKNNDKYKSIIKDPFYNYGGIKIIFEDIQNFIKNKKIKEINSTNLIKTKKSNDEIQFTFDYIDSLEKLALPLFYKTLIDTISKENMEKYTDSLFNQYSEKNNDIKKLLSCIISIPNIPIELLSRFYARLYTIESSFYRNMNEDLGLNKIDNYLPFIKTLYEGVKLHALNLASSNILYRGAKIDNSELKILKEYLHKKIPNLPGAIGFCKSFLSFSKDKKCAEIFLRYENKDKNKLSKVLYILENDDSLDYNLSTHGDMEKISVLEKEKEVLFFPFSSFEIKNIKDSLFEGEKIYEIRLLYLGQYLKKIESSQDLINKTTNLPESKFKQQIIQFGLIKPEKLKDINMKSIYNSYKKYEKKLLNITN